MLGSLTQEELIGRLTGDTSVAGSDSAPETAAPEEQAAEQAPAEPSEYQKQLTALIAQVYVLRDEYLAALDNTGTYRWGELLFCGSVGRSVNELRVSSGISEEHSEAARLLLSEFDLRESGST